MIYQPQFFSNKDNAWAGPLIVMVIVGSWFYCENISSTFGLGFRIKNFRPFYLFFGNLVVLALFDNLVFGPIVPRYEMLLLGDLSILLILHTLETLLPALLLRGKMRRLFRFDKVSDGLVLALSGVVLVASSGALFAILTGMLF